MIGKTEVNRFDVDMCDDCGNFLVVVARIADLEARLVKDAKAHEKEIAVWSENYAALERKLAEVEAERNEWHKECMAQNKALFAANDRAEAAEQLVAKLEAALATAQHALVVWDMAHRTGRNEPLVHAFETGVEALLKIKKEPTDD